MNTGAKEIQQANPGRPDKQPKHQASNILSIDKSPSRNRHRVRSTTHQHAIKEESKATNRDRTDHQARSPLQHTNATANLLQCETILINYAAKLLEPTIFFNLYTKSP